VAWRALDTERRVAFLFQHAPLEGNSRATRRVRDQAQLLLLMNMATWRSTSHPQCATNGRGYPPRGRFWTDLSALAVDSGGARCRFRGARCRFRRRSRWMRPALRWMRPGLRWMRPGSGGCGRAPVDAADARGGFGRDAKATREPPRAVIRAVSAKASRARAQTARGNPDGTRAESHAPRAPIRRREPTAGRGQWSSGRAPTPLTTGFGRSGLAGAAPHSRGTSTRATVLRTGGPSSRRACHERRHVTT
jgi:hypothetical protein